MPGAVVLYSGWLRVFRPSSRAVLEFTHRSEEEPQRLVELWEERGG